jgi:hypothetical protein
LWGRDGSQLMVQGCLYPPDVPRHPTKSSTRFTTFFSSCLSFLHNQTVANHFQLFSHCLLNSSCMLISRYTSSTITHVIVPKNFWHHRGGGLVDYYWKQKIYSYNSEIECLQVSHRTIKRASILNS